MVTEAILYARGRSKPSDYKGKTAAASFKASLRRRCAATVWLGSLAARRWMDWIDIDQVRVLREIDWSSFARRDKRILARWQREDERRLKLARVRLEETTGNQKSVASRNYNLIVERIEQRTRELKLLRLGIKALDQKES
jgi:hypothetical protein